MPTILARGDRVVATARSVEKIKHFEANPNCKTLQLDVTDSFENIQKVAEKAVALWGRVDVVVNNAGVGSPGISEEAGWVVEVRVPLDKSLMPLQREGFHGGIQYKLLRDD